MVMAHWGGLWIHPPVFILVSHLVTWRILHFYRHLLAPAATQGRTSAQGDIVIQNNGLWSWAKMDGDPGPTSEDLLNLERVLHPPRFGFPLCNVRDDARAYFTVALWEAKEVGHGGHSLLCTPGVTAAFPHAAGAARPCVQPAPVLQEVSRWTRGRRY